MRVTERGLARVRGNGRELPKMRVIYASQNSNVLKVGKLNYS